VNGLYNWTRQRMMSSQFTWNALPVRLCAFIGTYVFDEDHINLSSAGVTPVCESLPLINQQYTSKGYGQSDNAWFQNVPLTAPWTFLIMVDDTLVGAARTLIAYYDTGVNLPRQVNGQDELVIPDWLSQRGWFRP
jgi:hypothetical protein